MNGASGSAEPPRHSNRSARPRILEAARRQATERGYANLRLADITTEVGITHQGFYGHFANKRHALALATSEGLGAIVGLAMRARRAEEPWAERLLAEIDRALAEHYPSADGPERRLLCLLVEAIPARGFKSIRIAELVETAAIGQEEFYRRYGGRLGCLRRIYAELLSDLRDELASEQQAPAALERLGTLLAGDPQRTRLLILGASYLPTGADEPRAATQASLPSFVIELLGDEADPYVKALGWGALEAIRSAVLADRIDRLAGDLAELERSRRGEGGSRLAA